MQHPDHHTLERYVLDPPGAGPERTAIDIHLADCAGCRDLVERMSDAYARTASQVHDLETSSLGGADHLPSVQNRSIDVRTASGMAARPLRPAGRMEQARYFMRHHPIVTGAGTFSALAVVLLAATMIFRSPAPPRMNPAFIRHNEAMGTVEILDRDYKFLWQLLPTRYRPDLTSTDELKTALGDVDGDGYNEVVTTLVLPSEHPSGDWSSFRLFDPGGTLRMKLQLHAHADYLSRRYDDNWSSLFCFLAPDSMKKKRDIFIGWSSGRSPSVLTRNSGDGRELGRYWHFGSMNYATFADLEGLPGPSLLIMGIDDAEDSIGVACPFIAVLDPQMLADTGKSGGSQGFNMQTSRAERMYIRLPISPFSKALVHGNFAAHGARNNDGTISIWVQDSYVDIDKDLDIYEYIFSRRMELLEVKASTATERYYERKEREGLVRGRIDTSYLASMKEAVRYWNGEKYVKDPVRIAAAR